MKECEGFEVLPPEVNKCHQLETIEIRNCRNFKEFPNTISKCKALKFLALDECKNFVGFEDIIMALGVVDQIEIKGISADKIPYELKRDEKLVL